MFEKEAEEYFDKNKFYSKETGTICLRNPLDAFKDGAEFGYNKANEWHYPSKCEYPKEEGDYLFYLYDKETKYTFYEVLGIARTYADRDDLYIESMLWTLEDVIAWKEIVLPKEIKEK